MNPIKTFFLLHLVIFLIMFLPQEGLTDPEGIEIFQPETSSLVLENRGYLSLGEGDEFFDLAGRWQVIGSESGKLEYVQMPFAWQGDKDGFVLSRSFTLPSRFSDMQWRLVVDGFAQNISISLNKTSLDTRRGDGAYLQVELPRRVLGFDNSPNNLVISLNKKIDRYNTIPLRGSIYSKKHYGGVFYGIYLVASPQIRIADLSARWYGETTDSSGVIRIEADLKKAAVSSVTDTLVKYYYQCSLILRDVGKTPVYETIPMEVGFPSGGGTSRQVINIPVPNPRLWRIDGEPELYNLVLKLGGGSLFHSSTAIFGARTLKLTPGGFNLNGNLTYIRCLSYVNSRLDAGPVIDLAQLEEEIAMIKESGVNTIRILQGSAHPYMLDLCDHHGLLVFEELPVFQAPDRILADEDFIRSALEQMETIIERDRRFTCIAGWGIGSEINPPNALNREYYSKLTGLIHRADDRPVYASFSFATQISAEPLDFAILELTPYNSWIERSLPTEIDVDKPVLVGSIRRLVKPGNLGGWADPTSEAGQANYIVENVTAAESLDWCAGVVVGDFSDWLGSIPTIMGPLKGSNVLYTSGLTSQNLRTRPAYHRLKEYWTSQEIEPLNRGNKPENGSVLMLVVGFGLIFILVVATRQNNLFRFNLQRTFTSPKGFFLDISEHRYFQIGHTLLIAVLISGGTALILNGWLQAHHDSYPLDWSIGFLLGSERLINWTATLIWNPERGLLFLWAVSFIFVWIVAIQAMIVSGLLRKPCALTQCIDYVVWSFAGMLGVLPLGLVAGRLYRGSSGWVVTAIFLLLIIWSFGRLIIVYRNFTGRNIGSVLFLWLMPIPIVLLIVISVLQYTYHISVYWNYFWDSIVR